jgi:molybdopterin synthase sulfur carrier subunit
VEEAITELIEEYPDLKIHLMNEDGTLRNFVNLFLNGEDIRYLQGVETQLLDQDKLQIIPSIAGG